MKLYEILKGSEYSLDLFSQDAIVELENRIIERIDKKARPIRLYLALCVIKK